MIAASVQEAIEHGLHFIRPPLKISDLSHNILLQRGGGLNLMLSTSVESIQLWWVLGQREINLAVGNGYVCERRYLVLHPSQHPICMNIYVSNRKQIGDQALQAVLQRAEARTVWRVTCITF